MFRKAAAVAEYSHCAAKFSTSRACAAIHGTAKMEDSPERCCPRSGALIPWRSTLQSGSHLGSDGAFHVADALEAGNFLRRKPQVKLFLNRDDQIDLH